MAAPAVKNFRIFKTPDKELIKAFEAIAEDCGTLDNARLTLRLAANLNPPISGTLSEIKENTSFQQIINLNAASIFQQLTILFPNEGSHVLVERGDFSDNTTISIQNNTEPEKAAALLAATTRHLPIYERTEKLDRLLGDELAEFYRKREEGLLRLEGLSQNLIERNEEYRRKIDTELAEEKERLEAEYRTKSDELKFSFEEKKKELKTREQEVEELKKKFDDRSSKHARRQIRNDLKKALENRSKEFTLTKKTTMKRVPIHFLFGLLIIMSGGFLLQTFTTYDLSGEIIQWWPTVKVSFGAFAFIGSIVFYIRWNDNWFRQHAEEEFRLKRFELDIDRASWVVEMALEWKEEEGREIPAHLIERLTDNLFKTQTDLKKPTHPSEDLASAIISASSGLTLKIPGVGEVAIDKKGIRKIEKELAKRETSG